MTPPPRLPDIHFRDDCLDAMPFRFRGEGALPCPFLAGNAAMKLLAKGEPADKVLEHLSHRLTNKILHAPTQALHLAEGAERAELQAAAARLFHLHSGE